LWFVPAAAVFESADLYHSYAPAARCTTLLLLLVSYWLVRRLGRRLSGPAGAAALGFAWMAMPYMHAASYWSWTGNLIPGVMALIGLNALLSRSGIAAG